MYIYIWSRAGVVIQGYHSIEFFSPADISGNTKKLGLGINSLTGVLSYFFKFGSGVSTGTGINYNAMSCDVPVYILEELGLEI